MKFICYGRDQRPDKILIVVTPVLAYKSHDCLPKFDNIRSAVYGIRAFVICFKRMVTVPLSESMMTELTHCCGYIINV